MPSVSDEVCAHVIKLLSGLRWTADKILFFERFGDCNPELWNQMIELSNVHTARYNVVGSVNADLLRQPAIRKLKQRLSVFKSFIEDSDLLEFQMPNLRDFFPNVTPAGMNSVLKQ